MPFFDFPKEILDSILESLSLPGLSALSLTSKTLRTLTEPRLYSNIEMTWTNEHVPQITPLLRSLTSRPELSDYVLKLHLSGRDRLFIRRPPDRISLSGLGLDKAIQFIQLTKVSYANIWIEELQSGTMDAIVALLLSFLPNLKSLYLEGYFAIDTRLLGKMLRSALCDDFDQGLPKFHNLREVTFRFADGPKHDLELRKTADILSLFHFPAVERMSLSISNPVRFSWPGHEPDPRFLTSLKLYRIRESRLGPLLSVCINLKTLWWEWLYQSDVDPEVSKPVIELEQIAAAISQVSGTLEELTIEARGEMGGSEIEEPSLKMDGSLRFITQPGKLKRLEVPWIFLTGPTPFAAMRSFDMIPKSLESLTITDDLMECDERDWDESDIFYAVQSWVENWNALTPRLHRIRLLLKEFSGELEGDMRKELSLIHSSAGFEVEMIKLVKDVRFH